MAADRKSMIIAMLPSKTFRRFKPVVRGAIHGISRVHLGRLPARIRRPLERVLDDIRAALNAEEVFIVSSKDGTLKVQINVSHRED